MQFGIEERKLEFTRTGIDNQIGKAQCRSSLRATKCC